MRQAIEEGFILDVLSNYTDYKTFYKLVKQAEEDKDLPKRRTAAALRRFMAVHPHNVEQKTRVVIEHFRNHVRFLVGGKAKAMVRRPVSTRCGTCKPSSGTSPSRATPTLHPLVAFSGAVTDPDTGAEFTEPGMNIDRVTERPISETALPSRFDKPDYQTLLVAEKYQTGFDQPLLQAMYVDKCLDGVQAVQTLSRLNRVALGKEPPFVLDFVNDPETIRQAFAPYYDQTRLQVDSDPYQLDALRHELDEMQVYYPSESEDSPKCSYPW